MCAQIEPFIFIYIEICTSTGICVYIYGGTYSIIVIIIGNGYSYKSSIPRQGC